MDDKEIKSPSAAYLYEMRKVWQNGSEGLFNERDGRRFVTSKGVNVLGHDLKHNEKLRETITAIGEEYIPWCARKLELLMQYHDMKKSGAKLYSQAYEKIDIESEALDAQLVRLNDRTLQRLKAQDSGPSAEVTRQAADSGITADDTLRQQVALQILQSIAAVLLKPYFQRVPEEELQNFIPPRTVM